MQFGLVPWNWIRADEDDDGDEWECFDVVMGENKRTNEISERTNASAAASLKESIEQQNNRKVNSDTTEDWELKIENWIEWKSLYVNT